MLYFAAAIVLAAVYFLIAYGTGPHLTPDGTRDFKFARVLADVGFNPFVFKELSHQLKISNVMPQSPVSYFFFLVLLHVSELIAGENWAYFLVGCNVVFAVITSLLILRIGENCELSLAGMLVIFILTAVTWESNQWIAMTQSETLYCLISLLTLMAVHRAMTVTPTVVAIRWWGVALLMVVVCQFIRPTSLPIFALLGFTFCYWLFTRHHSMDELRLRLHVASLVLMISIALGIAVHAWIIFEPSAWQWQTLSDLANFFHPYHAQGWVVWERPETYVSPPTTVGGFAEVSFLRLAYFFWFLADDFSPKHYFVNLLTFVPMYFLFITGLVSSLRKTSRNPRPVFLWASIAIGHILIVDAYHAVTILDFDWRYRAVVYWAFYLFAGIGATELIVFVRDRLYAVRPE